MREIKFRAWVKQPEIQSGFMHYPGDDTDYMLISNGDGFSLLEDTIYLDERQFEVMQYIGLKDKNGKEIYEGDVVQMLNDRLKVIIEFKGGQFVGKNISYTKYTHPEFNNRNWSHWEVVGNIYENPELL